MNPFENVPRILDANTLLDIAFKRTKKVSGRDKNETDELKLRTFYETIAIHLQSILKNGIDPAKLAPFYRELLDLLVGEKKWRFSFFRISRILDILKKIYNEEKIKGRAYGGINLREAYGRLSSVIKKISDTLDFLIEAHKKMMTLPSLVFKWPIVCLAGPPSSGKSSIIKAVSAAKPKVASYPFTTKDVSVGHIKKLGVGIIQIMDTPGLLERPMSERNEFELKAIAALKTAANLIVYVFDPSPSPSMPLESQRKIYEEIKTTFSIPVIPVLNKADTVNQENRESIASVLGLKDCLWISAESKENLDKWKELLFNMLFSNEK